MNNDEYKLKVLSLMADTNSEIKKQREAMDRLATAVFVIVKEFRVEHKKRAIQPSLKIDNTMKRPEFKPEMIGCSDCEWQGTVGWWNEHNMNDHGGAASYRKVS